MQPKSEAWIFLASQKQRQGDRINTFNDVGSGSSETKDSLLFFNEIILPPLSQTETVIKPQMTVLLIPVAGAIEVTPIGKDHFFLQSGEALIAMDETLVLENPYSTERVYVIEVGIASIAPLLLEKGVYDLTAYNNLIKIPFQQNYNLRSSLGRFDNRGECLYATHFPDAGLFIFVLQGIFEIQGRLLNTGDSLKLSLVNENIDIEAFSNESLLLILEYPRL